MKLYLFYDDGVCAGLGHYRRVRALAHKLALISSHQNSTECVFCPIGTRKLESMENLHTFCTHIKPEETLGAVVDSYVFGVEHFALLDSIFAHLVCFDDTNRTLYPQKSFILNGAPNAHKLYPQHTSHHLLGLGFALCDAVFTPITSVRERISDIFVSFGGSDTQNLSAQILPFIESSALFSPSSQDFAPCTIHLVLGRYYPHTPPTHPNLRCYTDLNPAQMHALMQQCDIAISAGGGTLIELASSLIPTIMLESAPNQHFQITQFADIGAFKHAQNLTQIPKLIESLMPKNTRESAKDTLSTLRIGQELESALRNVFDFNP